ncbi:MAG: pyrroline-5-carboxylate reductase [Anaerolineae bacterium CG_4_9_14_3_um_filter_57_17]|nr:pyrroline-5-carboxylate reductase [bacterium]NCT20567.1 pyrroline-5-carboxylate reductase [bacterium]OIO86316.1 MAG: pyrroline-5-carboxylate reductase [Anaerolineae bacterium CG2_30_57_67]PJB64866.1 MAG: pyrroline-5-carboxylate reductase [Anaerolineae bacterium CG_4_9_14_3_um_filter_57_17]
MINKITLIGPGVMAEAMIAGLLRQNLAAPQQLTACGPRIERLEELRQKYGIAVSADSAASAAQAEVLILAVKPQKLSAVLKTLAGQVLPDALVLSIVAGASIQKIGAGLKHTAIVRSMPNTPGQIGAGITVWSASPQVSAEQQDLARQILGALGQEVFVEDEHYLDMATALSGSGPAYVFIFMEALIDAGVHMGFPRRIAEQLVLQTLKGSAEFYAQAEKHPAALRNQVTSPGGTSAEALYYLEKAGFRTAISRAVWAAYQRSLELGKDKPGHVNE